MSVRKVLASVALAGGLSGVGLIIADTGLVIGSTSDAGVMTPCINKAMCSPGGPIQDPLPPHLTPITSGSSTSAP